MKVFMNWLVLSIAVVALTACGGGGGSSEDPVVNGGGTTVPVAVQKTYSYDSTNRVTKEDLGNGQYIEYVYDESGNLISQTVVK